jgi:hypothetical protein
MKTISTNTPTPCRHQPPPLALPLPFPSDLLSLLQPPLLCHHSPMSSACVHVSCLHIATLHHICTRSLRQEFMLWVCEFCICRGRESCYRCIEWYESSCNLSTHTPCLCECPILTSLFLFLFLFLSLSR